MDKTLQMIADQFDRVALGDLRSRPGAKWQCPPPDVLPAWVADMDFPVAPAITDRLRQVLGQGDLGYPNWPAGATPVRCAFAARMADRYRWHPDPDHVREFANVTQAVQVILYLVTEPGDAVAVHTPAFRPFMAGIAAMRRRLVPIPMHDIGAGWAFDAQRFAAEVAATGCRVLLLVNPHNPTGRVFTRAELLVLADVAARHDLRRASTRLSHRSTRRPRRAL
jgi:cystathionine beta-lyase